MSETVDALGYKADVKTRTKEAISDRKDALVSKVSGNTPDSGEVKQGAKRAAGVAQENPLGLAIGAAVGFVAGMLFRRPPSRRRWARWPTRSRRQRKPAREAMERGGQVAEEAAESAKSTVQESRSTPRSSVRAPRTRPTSARARSADARLLGRTTRSGRRDHSVAAAAPDPRQSRSTIQKAVAVRIGR